MELDYTETKTKEENYTRSFYPWIRPTYIFFPFLDACSNFQFSKYPRSSIIHVLEPSCITLNQPSIEQFTTKQIQKYHPAPLASRFKKKRRKKRKKEKMKKNSLIKAQQKQVI